MGSHTPTLPLATLNTHKMLFLVLSLSLVSGGVWSLPTPHFGYPYMAPTLDKMAVGRYLSKPSPYDGMTAVLKHYGLEEDAINAMREMEQFTEVSIDEEGVLTFVYDVGEESETMSFTGSDCDCNSSHHRGRLGGQDNCPQSHLFCD